MTDTPLAPATVLEQYALQPDSLSELKGGLINRSFGARGHDGRDYVLQRVNAIFPPEVQDDIDAVTRHLAAKGLTTPRLVATAGGARFVVADGTSWRLLTRVPGETRETLTQTAEAGEAGRVLGEFHRALADFPTPLKNRRPPVHELARHLAFLERTLGARIAHPAHRAVTALAERIVGLAGSLPSLPALPPRLVHGDPKLSNVIFEASEDGAGQWIVGSSPEGGGGRMAAPPRAVCLIDLDTLTRIPVALELGDALRSWCNLAAEDSPEARISVERFAAALAGYRQGAGPLLTAAEWQAVPAATLSIAVELAARFAADALNESYFGWDDRRFARASEHNLARSAAQIALARSIQVAQPALEKALPAGDSSS